MKACRSPLYSRRPLQLAATSTSLFSSSFLCITTQLALLALLLGGLLSPVQAHRTSIHLSLSDQQPNARDSWPVVSSASQTSISLHPGTITQRLLKRLLLDGESADHGEKVQMGSRPPTCNSKCNQCEPCMAVQVPTAPQTKLPISPKNTNKKIKEGTLTASAQLKSNYKPENWKCTCGNKFYNP